MKLVGAALAFLLLSGILTRHAQPSTLPALPVLQLENTFIVVRRQVRQVYALTKEHPTDPAANGRLAMVLDAYQQYAAAEVCYRRAHLLDPVSFSWIYELGWVELKQGRFLQAAASFRAALKLNARYLPARMNLAESLLSAGELDESGQLFGEIAREHPESARAYYGLGRVATARGDSKTAIDLLQKACESFPRYGAAHYLMALELRKIGESQSAAEHFVVYRANPTTAPPVVDPLRAEVEALNQGPSRHIDRGIALEQSGDVLGAIREHQEAIAIDPQDLQAHVNLIQLYARAGDADKAEQEYRAAVAINPNRDDCYYNYGVMMFGLGKYSEAEQAFRHALAIDPYYAEAHNNLGALLERRGQLEDALKEFRAAVDEQPDYRLARFHLGRILVNQGEYAAAIQEFHKILLPDDASTPAYLYALAATYARAGDRENALVYFRKARNEAAALRQSRLVADIDRDAKALQDSRAQ